VSAERRVERNAGFLRTPLPEEIQECAVRDHIDLSYSEAESLVPHVASFLQALDELDDLPYFGPELKHLHRDPGRPPLGPDEDPYNAFIRLCHVEGAADGPLKGSRVAVKDNLAVAGVPITNASRTVSYVPTQDSVVVERILDAGGTIVGKLNLDEFSFGSPVGYGASSHFGPPLNPRRPRNSAGGSSGGAGSAVVSGAVDMALGVDEGGSARLPASYCGCVAIKGTHGLIPTFGLTYFDHTLDSICPMARTVESAAMLLQAVAGEDWRDAQWVRGPITVADYLEPANQPVEGMRVGIVSETLSPDRCDPEIIANVRAAGDCLTEAGAEVSDVSIPSWYSSWASWVGIIVGGAPPMIRSDGVSSSHMGYVDVGRAHLMGLSRRQEAKLYSPLIRLTLIANTFITKHYFNTVFGKAINQRLAFRAMLRDIFTRFDVLLTPTTPTTAPPLPVGRMTEEDFMGPVLNQAPFTAPLNLSGHPAIAVPSGESADGLPTSVQIVAREFAEVDALRVAFALERLLELDFGVPVLAPAAAAP
jgi:amidase